METQGELHVEVRESAVIPAERVVEALALLDVGRIAEARDALVETLAAVGIASPDATDPEAPVFERGFDSELDDAFAAASPESEVMIDADDIAFEAILAARLDAPEAVSPAAESPFHTRTMADLLERQGDAEAARAIRSALARQRPDEIGGAGRAQMIETLERWLARLRGGDA